MSSTGRRRCSTSAPPGMSPRSSPAPPGPDLVSPGAIAFKTGTSYGYRDAWATGFDGRHTVGVWVGRPDGAPVPGLIGIDAAAPILLDAFARIGPTTPLRAAPPGIVEATCGEPASAAPPLPLAERAERCGRRAAGDRLPAAWRADRPRHQRRRSDAACPEGARRLASLHVVRRWRADRDGGVRQRGFVEACRPGFRRPHGHRRPRRLRDGHRLSRIACHTNETGGAPCRILLW